MVMGFLEIFICLLVADLLVAFTGDDDDDGDADALLVGV